MHLERNISFSSLSRAPGMTHTLRRWSVFLWIVFGAAYLQATPDFSIRGWATTGPGTTGGAAGETVTVSTPADLIHHISRSGPVTIQVQGMIDLGQSFPGYKSNGRYYVESNKTIIGLGSDAGIRRGEFRLAGVNNVIIRNLTFRDAPDTAIAITHGTTHVWIDHNDLANAADGLVDISRASDFVTVSWNRFSNHDKTSLVGSSNGATGDRGHLRVTYHNNWFVGTNQRHPRVRYGKVHVFNNYYDAINAGIGIGVEAEIYSEHNFFDNSNTPYHYQDTDSQPGYMRDSGSVWGTSVPSLRSSGVNWRPSDHYSYTVLDANNVRDIVRNYAGVGVIDGSNPPEADPPPGTVEPQDPAGLIAYYPLTEGAGNVARDQSGFGEALDLALAGGATWLPGGGVAFGGGEAKLMTVGGATKLVERISGTGRFSFEVWAKPGHLNQPDSGSHPSRIVCISQDGSNQNFMFGHGGEGYQGPELAVRLRTTDPSIEENGRPNIVASDEIASGMSHYVVTYDGETVRIYRDGELRHSEPRGGDITNWDPSHALVLGNETSGSRGWVGEIYRLAIFDDALSAAEIQARFNPDGGGGDGSDSFASWLESSFQESDYAGTDLTDPNADPGGYGVPLLARYALGLDPHHPNRGAMHDVSVQPNPTSGYDFLTIEYHRRKGADDTAIVVEVSEDLQVWESLGDNAIVEVTPNGSRETVKVRDPRPVQEGEQRFMRLRIDFNGSE